MRASIHTLDLANGIKDALIRHGFTLHALAKISPSELAATLGIDGYVAKLISKAARTHAEADHLATETNPMMFESHQF
ncbi:MAG: hypothetical protein ABI361_13740 [Nitrososphaera sp.]|jgi:hypothetical protein